MRRKFNFYRHIAGALLLFGGVPVLSQAGTPISTPTADALELAAHFSEANDDWTPYESVFDDGVPMMLVPVGCFTIGAKPTDYNQHNGNELCFDAPFWIDKTEVVQRDFRRLGGVQAKMSYYIGNLQPVEQITWFEARDFCILRGGRLPTEAEWEYAARGRDELLFPWGDDWIPENASWNRTFAEGTANVGSFPAGASWVGALDMSGNVWEWTSSRYSPYPYDAEDGRQADTDDIEIDHVQRGGAIYNMNYYSLTTGARLSTYSMISTQGDGFRCVRDVAIPTG